MSDDHDSIFSACAQLLVKSEDLSRVRVSLASVTEAGRAAVLMRHQENRSKIELRLLPGIPSFAPDAFSRVVDQMERTTLVSPRIAQRLLRTDSVLRQIVNLQVDYHAPGFWLELDLDATLSRCGSPGDVFALFEMSGRDGMVAEALANLNAAAWVSPIRCTVQYHSGYSGFWDSWDLGYLELGSVSGMKTRLDEMADRQKISSSRAACFADWLDLLAERTSTLLSIRVIRK